jgi:RHS repeat-associated protein
VGRGWVRFAGVRHHFGLALPLVLVASLTQALGLPDASARGYEPPPRAGATTARNTGGQVGGPRRNPPPMGPFASGGPVDYGYDAAGRLAGVVAGADAARYRYDKAGNVLAVEHYPATTLRVWSVVPARAPAGTTVTISGTGFAATAAANTVAFTGGNASAAIVSASPRKLVVTVPDAAATGPITVTAAGASATSDTFTKDPPAPKPVVTGTAPTVGGPDTTVTITGSGFASDPAANTVTFGRTRAKVTAATATSLTVKVPAAAGSGSVSVRTSGGTASSPTDFVVLPSRYAARVSSTDVLAVDGAGKQVAVNTTTKVALLRFAGTQSQKLSLGVSSATFASPSAVLKVALFDPYGAPFGRFEFNEPWKFTGDGAFPLPPLPVTGQYTVIVDPDDAKTGTAVVTLSTMATGTLSTTDSGTPVALDRPGRFTELTFNATAGQGLSVAATGWNLPADSTLLVHVIEPAGDHTEFVRIRPGSPWSFIAGSTGTYRLLVGSYEAATGSATVALLSDADAGTVSVDGAPVTVNFARPGQNVRLHFTGTAGQNLGLGLTGLTAAPPSIRVIVPDGTVKSVPAADTYDLGVLKATGLYTVVIGWTGSASSKVYLSQALDVGTLVTTGTGPTVTPRPGQNIVGRFAGTAGQRISLGVAANSGTSYLFTAYKPDNSVLKIWASSTDVDLPALPAAGTYRIQVDPIRQYSAPTTLTLSQAADAGTAAVDGPATTINVTRLGQNAVFRLSGMAGERLGVGVTGGTFPGYGYVRIVAPDGNQLANPPYIALHGTVGAPLPVLPLTGTYVIMVDPTDGATGTATLLISKAVDGGTLTASGPASSAAITRTGQDAVWKFTGTSGATLQLGVIAAQTLAYYLTVYAPDGSTLTEIGTRGTGNLPLPALPAAGSYTVVVAPLGGATGTVTMSLTSVSPSLTTARAPPRPRSVKPTTDPASCTNSDAHAPSVSGGRPVESALGAGEPLPGWKACEDIRPPQPDSAWTPDQRNLAGSDWTTRTGPAPTATVEAPATTGTGVAGKILTVTDAPLPNVRVSIDGSSTTTDSWGQFVLTGVPAGHRILRVDGGTTNRGQRYGLFDIGVDLADGVVTALPYPVFLPQLDTAHEVTVASPTKKETVVTTPAIPGLELRLPKGTVIRDTAGHVVTRLGITAIPTDRPPFPLPSSQVPVYFTVQPGSATVFPTGAQLVYPNYTHAAAGTVMDFWHYDPAGRGWYVYGHGTVTRDGKQVVPDARTRVYRFTGAMLVTPGDSPAAFGPKPGNQNSCGQGGEPVDLGTGLFVDRQTDLTVPDVMPLAVTRTYRQGDTVSRAFGVGTSLGYAMNLWSEHRFYEADLVLPDGGRVHFRRTSPADPTTFRGAAFVADPTPTEFQGSTLVWNSNGWDLRLVDGTTYVFGDEAPLQAIRDKFGNTTTITRAPDPADTNGIVRAKGPITHVTSPNGNWLAFSYDTAGHVKTVTDNVGRQVSYTYKGDNLQTVTDPTGAVTTYGFNTAGRLATISSPRGNTYLTNEYDTAGRVHKQTQADGGTFTFDYTVGADGKITATQVTDPNGHVRKVTFNTAGFPVSDTRAVGAPQQQTLTIERDPTTNRPSATVDALGRRTELGYDPAGHLTTVSELVGTPDTRTTRYDFAGPFGQFSKLTDPLGHVSTVDYDSRGGVKTSTDAAHRVTTYNVNDAGQITQITDPAGKITTLGYQLGELTSVTDPLGRVGRIIRDQIGRVATTSDPLGNTTGYRYDNASRITTVTDPLGNTIGYGYDPDGDLRTVTDARGNVTTFDYDVMDRLSKDTDPLGRAAIYTYYPGGQVKTATNRRGQLSTYAYDVLDRRTETKYGVVGTNRDQQVTTTYDAGDRVATMTDSVVGSTATVTFDGFDRLTSVTSAAGSVSYKYDAAGRPKQILPSNQAATVTPAFNDDDTPDTVGFGGVGALTYHYDTVGRVSLVNRPGGYDQTYHYDDAGQLTGITYTHAGTALGELTYRYDAAGRMVGTDGSFSRVTVPATFGPVTFDNANQLTTLAGTTYGYDLDGNLTSDGTTTYAWNSAGQLTATSRAGQTTTFGYDELGRRMSRTAGGVTTGTRYAGADVDQEYTGTAKTGLTSFGPGGYVTRSDAAGTSTYLTDALGSPIALGDPGGNLQAQYTYDPFGAATVSGDDRGNDIRFTGLQSDPGGLLYARNRYYSPAQQRFISRDPIGFDGGPNQYAYVGNAPTMYIDPFGLSKRPPHPAKMTIWDERGNLILSQDLVSGEMTDEQKQLAPRAAQKDTHTEAKASKFPMRPGWTMLVEGSYDICSSCKGYLNRATVANGGTFVYVANNKDVWVSTGGRYRVDSNGQLIKNGKPYTGPMPYLPGSDSDGPETFGCEQ